MELIADEHVTSPSSESRWCVSWLPTSDCKLKVIEKRLLAGVTRSIRSYFVPISNENMIRTIECNVSYGAKPPLVLLHGFGAGVGFWSLNLASLSESHSVYAMDILGFGRSSRPVFPSDTAEAEDLFVSSIEEWRSKVGIDEMILLGHSFGGFLAGLYALKHPSRVRHLILADPWGFPEIPPPEEDPFPRWAKVLATLYSPFNPLAIFRAVGPLGPALVRKARPDIQRKFASLYGEDDTSVLDYIYHCNARFPSGEAAFRSLSMPYGYAKRPMIHRVKDIAADIPISIIYGSHTWMDDTQGYRVQSLREGSYVEVYTIRGAGHHVYADQAEAFNNLVTAVCRESCDEVSLQTDV